MRDVFEFADDLGPAKIVIIHDPQNELRAAVVIDNAAAGPALGGVRMAPDVTVAECFRLARAMTFKNAAAGLPHGGGKSVIFADPRAPDATRERLIRAFARAIAPLTDYVPGPDMGTNEIAMAWVKDEMGRASGLPREIGGIPLDEIGATGFGVAIALEAAEQCSDLRLSGARVVVQGFGAVGKHAARFLADHGARLVGVADSTGARVHPDGFDLEALIAHKDAGHPVTEFAQGRTASEDELLETPAEIWIPAARPDVLREDNVDRLAAKVVAEGANIPATPAAERRLAERGVLVIPDFIANAGGVIAAAVEYRGGTESQAFDAIEERIRRNTQEVLRHAKEQQITPRAAGEEIARGRVVRAMGFRRRV
jgi:glutamate dehydrogenase/leucine dehydrogenase